jgi:hypothetical protein
MNRISAGLLMVCAQELGFPLEYFFLGLPQCLEDPTEANAGAFAGAVARIRDTERLQALAEVVSAIALLTRLKHSSEGSVAGELEKPPLAASFEEVQLPELPLDE